MKYKLIHIDTLEVTMCEKINEHYVSSEEIKEGDWTLMFDDFGNLFLGNEPKQYLGEKAGHHLNKGLRKVIATTNTTLQCPQVVDYVEELAESNYGTDIDAYRSSKPYDLEGDRKQGFVKGYQKHYETHSLSDEEVLKFAEWSKDLLISKESLKQFKSTLPTKIYYR